MVELDIPPGQHMHPAFRGRLSVMAKWLSEMAEDYEASARWGARKLPARSRWAVLAAAGIYGDIAREVRARGNHAWDHRAASSLFAKLGWVARAGWRSEEHTSELQSLMRISYAVFCLHKKNVQYNHIYYNHNHAI